MLNHIAGLVLNTPLMTTPQHLETVLAAVGERIGVDASQMEKGSGGARADAKTPRIVGNGTLMIPVVGTLTHRATALQAESGVIDYGRMEKLIEDGMQTSDVNSILLDMSSPGGAVSGAFDFKDYVQAQRGRKPMAAIARDMMCSAAYLIGSATDRVYTTQTGVVGSIGVVMAHIDRSRRMEMEGLKPTFIHAGAMKTAGNSMEPLSDDARNEIQDEINLIYEKFVTAVAEARGLDAAAVKGTEARSYTGAAAVQNGLADQVATLSDAIEGFAADAPRSYPSMSIQGNADMNEDELRAEGATAERTRISAILGHDSAQGRTKMANHIAFNTSMSVDQAVPLLEASAVEAGGAPAPDALAAATAEKDAEIAKLKGQMGSAQSAALQALADDAAGVDDGGDGASASAETPEQARVAEAVAAMRAAQGRS